MKTIISKMAALLAVAAVFAFAPVGGEGFEISLNNNVVIQRLGSHINDVASLQLNAASPSDKICITYYHCGTAGKNRVLSFKDQQDRLVKEWRFADAKASRGVMLCTSGDILPLLTPGHTTLKLYYSSAELPKGRLLTSVTMGNNAVAKQ